MKHESDDQLLLPLGPVRNSELFSNYWLRHRLPLEPEWTALRDEAQAALSSILAIWEQERSRVEKYGSEAPLELAFIQPILEILGWRLFYQAHVQGRRPDYALFLSEESYDLALSHGRTSPQFWESATVVGDAKAWHVSLDRPARVGGRREYPPEQIEWYLDRTRLGWGIVTNGRLWRLFPRSIPKGKPRFQTYLEVDLPLLLQRIGNRGQLEFGREEVKEFLLFYLFFGPSGFRGEPAAAAPLTTRALTGSSEYAVGVSENLKQRVFEGLRLCIQGFLQSPINHLSPATDLEKCREESFVLLYRLLFIMYAEDRGLLPYRRNITYTRNRSLARQRDEIASILDRVGPNGFAQTTVAIWDDLRVLFDLVDTGHRRYEVPAYDGGLFSSDHHQFLLENRISDFYMAQVIDQLGRSVDPHQPEIGLARVDYRDLAIRELGSVYEGLLELRPRFASQRMTIVRAKASRRGFERTIPAGGPIPSGFERTGESIEEGCVYLETEKGERRATGSYYTPDAVVDHIVASALSPLCREISDALGPGIARVAVALEKASGSSRRTYEDQLAALRGDFAERILQLRILDPAMGSGHFLVRACQFLAEELATNPHAPDLKPEQFSGDGSVLVFWKRKVAEHCLFGVDRNSLAVELAKLALWLETVAIDEPLTFLNHHLRNGNSLVGARLAQLGGLPGDEPLLSHIVAEEFEARKRELLGLLHEVSSRDSAAPEDAKIKERLVTQMEIRSEGLRATADLWCGWFFSSESERLSTREYERLIQTLAKPRKAAALLAGEPFGSLHRLVRSSVAPFHWELEFLDCFFAAAGVREDAGFDAVIGNPPYDVLSTKETGSDQSPLQKFLRFDSTYEASFHGKNNLYKLFICRALSLLRNGGRLGLIVPMALLGDDYAVGIRRLIFRAGRFTEVHSFPQKDDPKRRVFPEAKLSTAVIGVVKTSNPEERSVPFPCVRHSADAFDANSPRLELAVDEIPLYDPENLAIVSCANEDWRLAIRILRSGRLVRLGELCRSFQGEVNEKTDGDRGFISEREDDGPIIMRGSNVCMYAIREASQGRKKYLCREEFLGAHGREDKAWHSQEARVGFQRSSPQNNFRRIIAASIAPDSFCFDTVSYVPASESVLPLPVLLSLLNSKLLDWYFRLGSTNSKVNAYQFHNLPCPRFGAGAGDGWSAEDLIRVMDRDGVDALLEAVPPEKLSPPFPGALRAVLQELATRVASLEVQRGSVGKRDRSRLCREAMPFQSAIDRLLFRLAGISDDEAKGLDQRLAGLL